MARSAGRSLRVARRVAARARGRHRSPARAPAIDVGGPATGDRRRNHQPDDCALPDQCAAGRRPRSSPAGGWMVCDRRGALCHRCPARGRSHGSGMEGSRGAWQPCGRVTPAPGATGPDVGRHDCRRASDFWHRLEHRHGAHSHAGRRRRLVVSELGLLGCRRRSPCRRDQRRRRRSRAERSRLDGRLHCHAFAIHIRAHEHRLDSSASCRPASPFLATCSSP